MFRYPGGKSKKSVQAKILARFPPVYTEYREPFAGGAGIFFAVPADKKRWINDLNVGLIEVHKALRDRSDEFVALCRSIRPQQTGEQEVQSRPGSKLGKTYNARLKAVFDDLKYNDTCDQALRYFFINRTVWGGRVTYDPKMESRMYFSNPTGWSIVDTERLPDAAQCLQGTQITCSDYSVLLEAPGEDVLIYCDPPYVVNTHLDSKSQLYEYGFSEEEHIRFADNIKKCKHKVIISYDDNELVRELFKSQDGFYLYEENWTYCGTANKKKTTGKELIITNYA